MLKIAARVVSSVQNPGITGYRHGLSFMRSGSDGLDDLEELLQAAAAGGVLADPAEIMAPAAVEAPRPAAAADMTGRLAALKAAAQAKLAEEAVKPKVDPQKEREQKLSEALQRAYWYFKELVEQLDVLKPAFPPKSYNIAGVPEFANFAWDAGQVDLRTRETSPTTKLFTRVIVIYRLGQTMPLLKVVREAPANDKFKQMLKDYGVEFSTNDKRTEARAVISTTFSFPRAVVATLELEGNFDTGGIVLKMKNVNHFGAAEHVLAPEAITQESLEELTGYVLGESTRIGPLLLQRV
jgi:hypothetical protein